MLDRGTTTGQLSGEEEGKVSCVPARRSKPGSHEVTQPLRISLAAPAGLRRGWSFLRVVWTDQTDTLFDPVTLLDSPRLLGPGEIQVMYVSGFYSKNPSSSPCLLPSVPHRHPRHTHRASKVLVFNEHLRNSVWIPTNLKNDFYF